MKVSPVHCDNSLLEPQAAFVEASVLIFDGLESLRKWLHLPRDQYLQPWIRLSRLPAESQESQGLAAGTQAQGKICGEAESQASREAQIRR